LSTIALSEKRRIFSEPFYLTLISTVSAIVAFLTDCFYPYQLEIPLLPCISKLIPSAIFLKSSTVNSFSFPSLPILLRES
jgi:hypothetical protein